MSQMTREYNGRSRAIPPHVAERRRLLAQLASSTEETHLRNKSDSTLDSTASAATPVPPLNPISAPAASKLSQLFRLCKLIFTKDDGWLSTKLQLGRSLHIINTVLKLLSQHGFRLQTSSIDVVDALKELTRASMDSLPPDLQQLKRHFQELPSHPPNIRRVVTMRKLEGRSHLPYTPEDGVPIQTQATLALWEQHFGSLDDFPF